ncbi:MAG: transglutaminase family protein [Gemmataceae bacterium]
MMYDVRHVTTYRYSEAVTLCQNIAHLTPRNSQRQTVYKRDLWVRPDPVILDAHTDFFGNTAHFFSVQEPHRELTVTATHRVDLRNAVPPPLDATMPWDDAADYLRKTKSPEALDAYQYVFDTHLTQRRPQWLEYASPSFVAGRPIGEACRNLMGRIYSEFRYDPQATTVSTPLIDMFAAKRGVCQDFAHFMLASLRSLGLAARYVSGYLETAPPPGKPRLVGADASHAWLQVYFPEHGWYDFDPTNDTIACDRLLLLAWGRDYDDVSPLKGVILGGGTHTVNVAVDVVPATDSGGEVGFDA